MIRVCELVSVGTELLLGQTLNTNAYWLAQKLSLLGISCLHQSTVGDNPGRMQAAIRQALSRADAVILTGGLGPTQDDITMAMAAQVLGLPLKLHDASWRAIQAYFEATGRVAAPSNQKQAMLPEGAKVLPNLNGTAPGAIIEAEVEGAQKAIILLPGPPREMKMMFEHEVQPYLDAESPWRMTHHYLRLIGIGESDAERTVIDLIEAQDETTIAPYAHDGEMMFRVTRRYERSSDTETEAKARAAALESMHRVVDEIKARLGQFIYHEGLTPLPELVIRSLIERNVTFGFAESLTGGLCAAEATQVPGVSAVFRGGIVSYHSDLKCSLLGVSDASLALYSAVSSEVAEDMARGARKALGVDYAVSLTGYAGPNQPSDGTPIGRTFIAVAGPSTTDVHEFTFRGNREKVRAAAALHAFNCLRVALIRDGIPVR